MGIFKNFIEWVKDNYPIMTNHGGKVDIHELEAMHENYKEVEKSARSALVTFMTTTGADGNMPGTFDEWINSLDVDQHSIINRDYKSEE